MSHDGIDFYEAQRMIEDEARERRAGDDDLRQLVAMRESEAHEAILELREHVASLERGLNSRTEHLA